MRKVMLTMSAALVLAVSANAEMVEKTTTTRYSGTIAETSPSTSTIILKEDSPKTVRYIYNDRTVWEDASGKTVRMETVRDQPATINRIYPGISAQPMKTTIAHYLKTIRFKARSILRSLPGLRTMQFGIGM